MSLVSGNVLVTGATGGLGHAIVRRFAASGAKLTLTGRRHEVLAALAEEVGGQALECDLGDRSAVDRLLAGLGPVDVLVANAGHPASGLFLDLSPQEIDRLIDVNLRAAVILARAVAPGMVARGSGHMVFMSSLAGKAASAASSLYSATKFGLRGFALALREDLRRDGVGVSVVAPGFISEAGMFAEADLKLPWPARAFAGTRSPEHVAAAVIRAVERNRAEIDVAPLRIRLGAAVASVLPQLASTVSRSLGSEAIALSLAEAQRDKR